MSEYKRADTQSGIDQCEWTFRIIELTGESGKNGRFGTLVEEHTKAVARIVKLEAMMIKILLASATGGGIVAGITKLIG